MGREGVSEGKERVEERGSVNGERGLESVSEDE